MDQKIRGKVEQKIRGKDEAETSARTRQAEADILRGKDDRQHQMLPRGASRQAICLEDYNTDYAAYQAYFP